MPKRVIYSLIKLKCAVHVNSELEIIINTCVCASQAHVRVLATIDSSKECERHEMMYGSLAMPSNYNR